MSVEIMRKTKPIIYYTSAHGYGHGVRTCDILLALYRLYPEVPLILVTALQEDFLRNRLGSVPITIRSGCFDVGMVQLDSVKVDIEATLAEVTALYSRKSEVREKEADFLRAQDAGLVIVDVPAIPVEAAKAVGIPALAVANFAWDWIYSEFVESDPRWEQVIAEFAQGYAKTDLLLRLPFAGEMEAFPEKEDIPLVASPGLARREELASLTGCDRDKQWILLSFTTLNWTDEAQARVEALDDVEFITVKPLEWNRRNLHVVDREEVCFSDVLASVDAVISKPGFGLVSECIVNRKPLVYVDRTEFLEYPMLVEGIEKYLRNVHLPQELLYKGELREAVDAIRAAPEPPDVMLSGGSEIAARRIMSFL